MASDLEEILQRFVPKRLYDELRRDYDRLLIRLGRMEEQLLMLSEYRLEPEESTDIIDRKIRTAERGGRRRARDLTRDRDARDEREEQDERDEREAEPGRDRDVEREREVERERPEPRREREGERERRRALGREPRRRAAGAGLDESLAEESTDELIRRLRMRYREISRLRDRLREEEE